jgi:hypothetical protein
VVDTLKGTGKGLVLGGGGGLIGGASSTISNPVMQQSAAIGGDVALNAGVAYAETGSVREAVLAGASSIAVSGSVAAARQHPPSAKVPMDQRDINAIRNPNAGTVSGEIVNRMLPDGAPHAPAQPNVIVDRSAYMVEPGQAGISKALGPDPSKSRVVALASDGNGADFQVVAGGAAAATNSQKLLPPGVTYTNAGGTGSLPYGGIAIRQSGDVHVTTGTRPGGYPSHQDLMNGQFGRVQIGERRFGIEGGAGSAIVTRTSGATGFPTLNDLPSIQRALSEAGRLESAIVHVMEGKTATAYLWTGEGWTKVK